VLFFKRSLVAKFGNRFIGNSFSASEVLTVSPRPSINAMASSRIALASA
jgi:hypothetical protein